MIRDRERERELTLQAAALERATAHRLVAFADQRAGDGPVELEDRDLTLEALEELADARNYIVWRLRQLREADTVDIGEITRTRRALGLVAAAYESLAGPLV